MGQQTEGRRASGYVKAIASPVLFGFIALFTTTLYDAGATGTEIVFWRLLTATFFAAIYARWRGVSLRVTRGQLPWLLLLSVLYAGGIIFLCLGWGTDSSAGLVSTIYHAYPLMVMVLAFVFAGQRPTLVKIAAVACAMAGVLLILAVSGGGGGWEYTVGGVALPLMSALCYAVYSLLLEHGPVKEIPTPTFFFYGCVAGVLLCLPFTLAAPTHMELEPVTVSLAFLLGLGCTVLPYLFYISATRTVGATSAALLSYLEYPVTILLLALVAAEVPTLPELAGSAFIVAGGVLTVLPERAERPERPR